jgi:hypothetical protein
MSTHGVLAITVQTCQHYDTVAALWMCYRAWDTCGWLAVAELGALLLAC